MEKKWVLYILLCKDDTFYTGITDDLERRLAMHRAGKGAKYTRGRSPLILVYKEECQSHSDALKRECFVKKLRRAEKEELIKAYEITAAE
jgi:pyrroline-5-carboxylate reductase